MPVCPPPPPPTPTNRTLGARAACLLLLPPLASMPVGAGPLRGGGGSPFLGCAQATACPSLASPYPLMH